MKKLFFLLCAGIIFLNANGQSLQNKILEHLSYSADSSIVREWRDGYCILYTSTVNDDNYFHLVDMNSGAVHSIAVTYKVADMEILGDTLFFCGNTDLNFPTTGVFYIPNILTSSITVRHLYYPTVETIVPKRMDVIRVANGFHIFVTGDWSYAGSGFQRSFVADVSSDNAVGSWRIDGYKSDEKECFDDVAATDNYVVTVGHIDYSNDMVVRVFERPIIFCYPSYTACSHHHMFYDATLCGNMYFYSGNARPLVGSHGAYPISITSTLLDTVAIAYMADFSEKYGLSIKTVDVSTGVPAPQQEINIDGVTEKYDVKDIRYDKLTDTLMVLQDKPSNIDGIKRGYIALTDNGSFSTLADVEPSVPIWMRSFDKFNAFNNSKLYCGEELWSGTHIPTVSVNALDGLSCFIRTPKTFDKDAFKFTDYPLLIVESPGTYSTRYNSSITIISTMNYLCHEKNDEE